MPGQPPPVPGQDFIPCVFAARGATSKTLLRWVQPNEVVVSVQLPGRGGHGTSLKPRRLAGFPAQGEGVQKALAGVGDLKQGAIPDYTLTVTRAGKRLTQTWSADTETGELAALRGMLEAVGHLACAEAVAYWEAGRQLGRNGVFEPALRSLRTGLARLGDRYRSADLRDDTGLHLVIAGHHEETKQWRAAWDLAGKVLRSRILAYQFLRGVDLGVGS
jgi:hypothetical protein